MGPESSQEVSEDQLIEDPDLAEEMAYAEAPIRDEIIKLKKRDAERYFGKSL